MTLVAYKSDPVRGAIWHEVFRREAPDLVLTDWSTSGEVAQAPYLVAWTPPADLGVAMPNLRAFFCMGAGTDHLPWAEFPPGLPVVRMVDEALTQSMAEYVAMAVLMLHRDMASYRADQAAGRWSARPVRAAADRRVGVMGLGVMGQAALQILKPFGFPLAGWSASRKRIDGVETFAGMAELDAFLDRADILVCLLPLTSETRGLLDADLFRKLPEGAMLVNAGRGGHVVEGDLLRALDEGRLASAVLDVLLSEPPSADDPLLAHPAVVVTPHVASATHPAGAARQVIAGIRAQQAGRTIPHTVDRTQGY
ncbi:glyoxylate/hydroxypyruvate reductase A [Aureimonas sp. ME7]|uniref:2-hydroxyacid dehydrogenase n=1 Tax=Aureimonas sp. ME7 TaxID=2744252 RepID=UPI0015F90952|nr:glyoxylate/hydroxypyruvate reductase A [Aureimonas sp. ME7]